MLTTSSNWSRLINELRIAIAEPTAVARGLCAALPPPSTPTPTPTPTPTSGGSCTGLVDLQYGEWPEPGMAGNGGSRPIAGREASKKRKNRKAAPSNATSA